MSVPKLPLYNPLCLPHFFQFDTPFERAIVYAVTLGGDTDTIATMAGAMAGAYYGIEDIPKHWRDICEGVDDAVAYGEKLYNMTLTSTAVGDEEK